MTRKLAWMGAALAVSLSAATTHAAVSADEAAKLKSTLTPLGGERAGNAEGSIPVWNGGLEKSPFPNYRPGTHRPDPFASDRVLLTITAQNMNSYADHLAEGEKAMFRAYPQTFKMNIYASRRTAAVPDWVEANTFKCATSARVKDWGVEGCVGGTPFPILSGSNEDQAMQAIWNHILRFRGVYLVRKASSAPVQRNGSYALNSGQQEVDFRYYHRDIKTTAQLNNIIFYYLTFVTSPARLAGGAVLVWETLDQRKDQRQAWGYNAGQRRVRQAPNLAYDTPIAQADGLITADDVDMYNGSPDKYDWKLVGKKEIFIPYNNYKVNQPSVKYKNLLMPGHLNPDYLRYELHRVWVVEATLKEGMRHIFPRRVMFIDEDSWTLLLTDLYDAQGKVWRVQEASLWVAPEIPACVSQEFVGYDLNVGRYIAETATQEHPPTDWLAGREGRINPNMFSPDELRRRGER